MSHLYIELAHWVEFFQKRTLPFFWIPNNVYSKDRPSPVRDRVRIGPPYSLLDVEGQWTRRCFLWHRKDRGPIKILTCSPSISKCLNYRNGKVPLWVIFRYCELIITHDTRNYLWLERYTYASSKSKVACKWVYNLKTTYPSFNVIQNTT